jgi:hypothetical protein
MKHVQSSKSFECALENLMQEKQEKREPELSNELLLALYF